MMVAIDRLEHLGRHSEVAGRLPNLGPVLHESGRRRMAKGMGRDVL